MAFTNPFAFADSQYGSAANATGIKSLVNVVIDRRYHKTVQAKTWFKAKGMIGPDTYNEGNYLETAAGYPVILKQDLTKQPGDTIIMSKRTNLATTNNLGKVGAHAIVDSEVGWDYHNKKVKIEQWRQAVATVKGMNEQRNPFEPFEQTEIDLLSDWSAQVEDNGLLYAQHYRWCPHLFRMYGHTNLVPTANPNMLFGNDESLDTTRTVANLEGDKRDNVKGITFEIGYTYMMQNNFDLVSINGDKYAVVLISPAAALKLRRDTEFRNALVYARERSTSNPLFKYATYVYNNCIIFEYDKIRSLLGGYNPAGLTVSNAGATNSTITEAAYTGIGGGVTSSQLHQTIFLGANALALAEGPMKMGKRAEDDYGLYVGRDADNIWGATRMDFIDEAAAVVYNQSSLAIVNTNV